MLSHSKCYSKLIARLCMSMSVFLSAYRLAANKYLIGFKVSFRLISLSPIAEEGIE